MSRVFTDSKIIDDLHEYEPYKYEPSYMDAEATMLETPTPHRAVIHAWEAEASERMDKRGRRRAFAAAFVDWLLVGAVIVCAVIIFGHFAKELVTVLAGG